MPLVPRGRLFQQILLSVSAALIVSFMIAATITLWVGTRALKSSAEADLHGVAHLVHLRVESFLEARLADLRLTAAVEAMDDIVTGDEHFRIQNSLMRLRRELPGLYEELLVTDMNGGTIAATRLERLDARPPIHPGKLGPAADGTRLSAGPVDLVGVPRKVLVLARPIVSRIDGEPSGWLIALVRWEAISRMVSEIPIGGREQRNTAFAVIECLGKPAGGGMVWLDPVATADFTVARDHMREALDNNSPGLSADPKGPPAIGPAYEWEVVVRRDPAEAFAIVRVFGYSVIGAGILGLLFAALVAVRLAGRLAQRIERLDEGTRKLAAGDYASRVADPVNDELGDLAKAFDAMADTLQSTRRDIEKVNTELAENNRQLLEASKLKDEFLANISHELRTPLNGTLGFLGLVTDDLCDTPEEERENVQQAFRCAHQLKMLIEDVLDVSRIEAGRMALARDAVPVKQALDRVIAEMFPLAHAKGITFRCEPLEDERLTVRADAQRLHQVLRHLVDNAIKFTPAGTITLACVTPEAAGHARFEVRDSGIGMSPDQLDRAFERFVQGDGSATRMFGGTGLGLSLVRDLVQMMGGVVRLESAGEDKGMIASFTLPLGYAASAKGPGGIHAAPDDRILGPATGPLVLVVDDDEAFTSWLRAILHADGFRTAATDSAERARMMARRLHPAVLLVDHALPAAPNARIRSGAELARHLAGHRTTSDLPVIVLSGHDPVQLEGEGALPNGVALLRKPVHREDLLLTLWRTVAAHRRRAVRVLLAHEDPRLVSIVRRALPENEFDLAIEAAGPALLEVIDAQIRHFDVVLLEPTADIAPLRRVLDALAKQEAPPPVLAIAEAERYEHPEIADLVSEWPIQGHYSIALVQSAPQAFASRVRSLGSSLAMPEDGPATDAA